MDYTFSIGTDDPNGFAAENDAAAVARAVALVRTQRLDDLRVRPEAVTVLLGPGGLVTRPSERLDEFVERVTLSNPAADPDTFQPGDTNTPDCNGD
jgi:hypothetical protein